MLIRKAIKNDSKDLFDWRNDPITCAMSFNSEPVKWEDHKQWFAKTLNRKNRKIYIAIEGEIKIGMVRFDIDEDIAYVSINLNPEFRGQSKSSIVLNAVIDRFNNDYSKIRILIADIKPENEASLRCFSNCYFKHKSMGEYASIRMIRSNLFEEKNK